MDNYLGLADPSISTAILYSWQVRMLTSSPLGEYFFNKTIFRMFSNQNCLFLEFHVIPPYYVIIIFLKAQKGTKYVKI